MFDASSLSPAGAILGAAGIAFLAWKAVWPLLSQWVATQTTQGRVESGSLTQLSNELYKSLARAESAENRADGYFADMADMKAQIALLTYQLKASGEQTAQLTAHLAEAQKQIKALTDKISPLAMGGS